MIHFQEVSKYYDTNTALRNITLSIEKGEMAFITGPSGAGKTTLLKLIYAAELPDSGKITIAKWEMDKLDGSTIPLLRRTIGIVFQDFRLLFNKNVFDNVALALRVRNVAEKEIREEVFAALKMVNLRHKTDSFPSALSGGEQQRVVIARAIVGDPTILLADEPTGNLDTDTATGIMNTFKEINARGTTVLIATHNRELFRNTGKRVVKLDGGTVTAEEKG
ncbi:MAG TPA: cell division ATP-binding protein FtsE [Nitrospiraceae bacterium]|jgi:cell division transport system ATP-binding protein|nr:cell division ATP-binding protein FtsE [Nitrospiraceae bacterium]